MIVYDASNNFLLALLPCNLFTVVICSVNHHVNNRIQAFTISRQRLFNKNRRIIIDSPYNELIELKNSTRDHRFTDLLNAASVLGYGHMAVFVNGLHTVFNWLINNEALQVIPPSPAIKKGDTYAYV
ncbi:hypothetical protein [[Flexibacter] sp. ATCC 35208]|uniref:hypothetical protein n=1 Tax=[Flexibacter] sp. ATCC 35208 TaxID=1936242 RepID=UPI0009C4B274|nr:hypothetical protein [[Flexibacter] sp. ATCC 35208]OMP79335.1 hypothetical protein BW716_09540 [[Flexibacter] sp. ATCC 35208]